MKNTAFITVDLAYGDSGKGTIVDALCRKQTSNLVVRYTGGAQAGHKVQTDDGRIHVFSQFGSGTFIPWVNTLLSKYVLINPMDLMLEEEWLQRVDVKNAYERMHIDERAYIITPYHIALNRLRELARKNRHGSCGKGVGEAYLDSKERPADAITIADLNSKHLADKLDLTKSCMALKVHAIYDDLDLNSKAVQDELDVFKPLYRNIDVGFYRDFYHRVNVLNSDDVNNLVRNSFNPVFEGAQGVGLDEEHGFHPYSTWSNTTQQNASQILQDCGWPHAERTIGITRTLTTRHGAGPLVTLDMCLTNAYPDTHNGMHSWQGQFRVGWLDLCLLGYTSNIIRPFSYLAVTHADKLTDFTEWKVCNSYNNNQTPNMDYTLWDYFKSHNEDVSDLSSVMMNSTPNYETVYSHDLIGYIETNMQREVGIISFGPQSGAKQFIGGFE